MSEQKLTEQLFTDSGAINKKDIVDTLKNILDINRETYDIYFKEEANDFTIEEKIIAYGLAKKLLKTEGYIKSEEFSANEIKKNKNYSMKDGSVDNSFKALREKSDIRGSGSKYLIPNYKIGDSLKKLNSKIKNDQRKFSKN